MRLWRCGGRKGQVMAEFALVLPLFLFLLLAMVTFGVMINTKIALSGAARETARSYAVYQDSARMRQTAEDFLRGSVVASEAEFAASFNRQRDVRWSVDGDYVTVTVTYWQRTYVPGLFALLGGSRLEDRIALSSSATFKIER